MKRIGFAIVLAMATTIILADLSLARPVFLKDGSRIEAVSVRKSGEKVYVLLNRESQITLRTHEVDLVKTFDKKWDTPAKKPVSPPPRPAAVETEEVVLPSLPEEPLMLEPVKPDEVQEEPPALPEAKQEVQPPPPAPVAKPKPAPRPVVTPAPIEAEPDFDEGGIVEMLMLAFIFLFILVLVASFWKVFTKAGEAGWKSLVPLYNFIVLLKISGTPIWWIILFFIPVLNIGASVFLGINLAKRFGKGALYGLGLCFLSFIFYPHLAFSKATYQ